MRKRNWLDIIFLVVVLTISAFSTGLVSFPRPEPPAPATAAALVPTSNHHSGHIPQVEEAAQALTVFLAPLNAPSSLVVNQMGEYLSQPGPEPDPLTCEPAPIED